MAEGPKQTERVVVLKTSLPEEMLSAVRFDGVEGLSELFEFTIEAVGERKQIDFNSLIGNNCAVTIKGKTADRLFNGILVQADHLGASTSLNTYRLVLKPWLWLLAHSSDCRIFHKKSTPEIIQKVFRDRGFQDFKLRLTENYKPREYCVQFRETDLDFVCRLMEEDGIYYYFEHSEDKHVLVLADSKSSHDVVPGLPRVRYLDRMISARSDVEAIFEIITNRSFQPGKVSFNDYDPKKPNASMKTDETNSVGHAKGTLELYDYPGRYTETSDGNRFSKVRLQAMQARDKRRHAVGEAAALMPGGLVTLENHPEPSENIEFLVVRCAHHIAQQDYRSGGGGGDEPYSGTYEFQASETTYRAPQVTRRPQLLGGQVGIVTGSDGEEIDVDDMGRILVKFPWARDGEDSRRCRVVQSLAGKSWGSMFIPRIGQEVVVDFLHGDPDYPYVVGTVYNGINTVPYELPANKTKNGIKTNSSKGGGGYNELVFEDKKSSEEIGIHAQKDLNVVVLNSETREIAEKFSGGGASRKTTLKKGDDELDIKIGNQKIDIAQDQKVKAGKSVTIEATASITLKVGSSSIKIDPSGVTIKGTGKVDINGGGMLKANAGIIKLN
ncbi:MAG: type VI secretion system tip protein TssI/VgrG [Pseudomonadota bacterium]